MTDIAPIKGLIELTDNFTTPIGLAEAALSNFSEKNQESLKAVAGAAGIVVAAFTAVAAATIELGKRGAEVNAVNATLQNFAGGANAAKNAMSALQTGTKGTVDNFTLAKDAAHLLSAGVQLTAQDFGTLGKAAIVLNERGLGDTKTNLELVSDALVTGRTRALAMSLGVIATDDAQEKYAKTLGVSVDQLSNAGKAEANRLEVMRILADATKNAGDEQRNFAQEIQAAQTSVVNWVDDLGSAIASSKVFASGFRAIETAVEGAFDGDKAKSIDTIVRLIEDGAIKVIDFAQAAITMARIVEGAWEGVRTIILGTETVIVGLLDGIVEGIAAVAEAGSKLHIIDPATTAEIEGARTVLRGMTVDLAEQTAEAAKAVVGHTEFDKTLDGLSTSLGNVRVAMTTAQTATDSQTKAAGASADAAKKNAASQGELNAKMIDQAKVVAAVQKSTVELAGIWDDYFAKVAQATGTSQDAQVAAIEATFNKQIAALDALDPLYNAKYAAYRQTADQALGAIAIDWDNVRDQSIEGMQQMADKALATYMKMTESGLHFSRDVLDAQKQKYVDLEAKARGWGDTNDKVVNNAKNQVVLLSSAWDAVGKAVDDNVVKVKMLDGEVVSVAEALKRLDQGGSQDVSSANFAQMLQQYITDGGLNPGGVGIKQYRDPTQLAKAGYSFGEVIKYAFDQSQQGPIPPPLGPRIPGFAEGGIVMVGEKGPEPVRLPFGSQVYPTGTPASKFGGGTTVNQYVTVQMNGTVEQTTRQVKDRMMRELKSVHQFSQ